MSGVWMLLFYQLTIRPLYIRRRAGWLDSQKLIEVFPVLRQMPVLCQTLEDTIVSVWCGDDRTDTYYCSPTCGVIF